MTNKQLLKGNIAIAASALESGCQCYFGYPITPQTEIGEYLSFKMQEKNLAYVCAESEIAAINMAIGAAAAGAKVMTSSSSCAVALMQESLSYACSDELPIVLVNVMRAGPGQGYIFPSQGDYNQATIGGGNGDYHTIVLSPSSVQEASDLTSKAFYLAQKYKNPVILLADGLLGQMAEPAEIKTGLYDEIDNSSWRLDGAKDRPSRKIHSLEASQLKLNQHNIELKKKYDLIEKNEIDYEEFHTSDAEIIITAFGTMARYAKEVVVHYRSLGVKMGLFRPISLYPFPYEQLRELSLKTKLFIDIEMNLGQMLRDVKLSVLSNAQVTFIGKPVGDWLKKEEMIQVVDNLIKEQYASIL